jgi:hypothetical protein
MMYWGCIGMHELNTRGWCHIHMYCAPVRHDATRATDAQLATANLLAAQQQCFQRCCCCFKAAAPANARGKSAVKSDGRCWLAAFIRSIRLLQNQLSTVQLLIDMTK